MCVCVTIPATLLLVPLSPAHIVRDLLAYFRIQERERERERETLPTHY